MISSLEQEGLEVRAVCEVLGVSRSGYYRYQQEGTSQRERDDQLLKRLVQDTFWAHRRRYGSRRIVKELVTRGEVCGRGRIRRIMQEMGLVAIQPRSFKPRTTDSRHALGYNDNLLLDASPPMGINQVWVGDITYIPLKQSFAYLSLLMDLYSRRIVGWQLLDHMRESLVLASLRLAIGARQPPAELIHHTDRGGQYAGKEYRCVLARAQMRQSMSRADNCYDNAFMESCFGTIKTELEQSCYESLAIARQEIGEYINYYNTLRRHSALEYLSPVMFERSQGIP